MAQDNYPAQTVKIVMPSAPGSTTDILARLTADALGRKWGKPTIVENIAGGSMNIGAGQAFRARRPTATRCSSRRPRRSRSPICCRKSLTYNPLDWVPITMLAKIANVLSVRTTPARQHAPGADRLRQGQSGQAHLRDAGPDLDRASVGGAARGA